MNIIKCIIIHSNIIRYNGNPPPNSFYVLELNICVGKIHYIATLYFQREAPVFL